MSNRSPRKNRATRERLCDSICKEVGITRKTPGKISMTQPELLVILNFIRELRKENTDLLGLVGEE